MRGLPELAPTAGPVVSAAVLASPSRSVLVCLALLSVGCGTGCTLAVAADASDAAHSSTAEPARFAASPLTELAEHEAARAVALFAASTGDVIIDPDLTEARPGPTVAVRLNLLLSTERSAAAATPVLAMQLLLTGEALTLESVAATDLPALPRARRDARIEAVAAQLARRLADGRALHSADSGLASCQALRGDLCADPDGIYRPDLPAPALREAFGGGLLDAQLTATTTLVRLADGRLLELRAAWEAPRPRKPSTPAAPLRASAPTRWTEPDRGPAPTQHLDPDWSRWCAHDWSRLPTSPQDLSSRCLLQLLSDAYGSPVQGGRIADMMMLDFDPMPPPDEARLSVDKLEAMKRHLAHRCTTPDTTACGRVLESIELGITRKLSLFENVSLGDFTPLLRAALAGEPLPDDLGATGRSRWSELTLDKLAAAVWIRHGFHALRPDLRAFFHGERGPEDPDGAGLLPLPWPDSRLTGLTETDRANLARIERNRR